MEIRIRSKNLKLTTHLEDYIKVKFSKVEKFIPDLIEKNDEDGKALVSMELEIEKITKGQNKGDVYRVEAQMFVPGASLRAEDVSTSPKEAISEARYELQRQVKEYKEKQNTLKREGGREVKEIIEKKI